MLFSVMPLTIVERQRPTLRKDIPIHPRTRIAYPITVFPTHVLTVNTTLTTGRIRIPYFLLPTKYGINLLG